MNVIKKIYQTKWHLQIKDTPFSELVTISKQMSHVTWKTNDRNISLAETNNAFESNSSS